MGCLSSKVAGRTGSLRKRINSFAVLEQILVAKNAGDQPITVVKTDGKKVKDHDQAAMKVETINTWELMAGLEEEVEATHLPRRSQSFDIVNERREGTVRKRLSHSRSCISVEEHEKVIAGEDGREGSLATEKGLRRKTMARQLSALVIPNETEGSVEFPDLVSLPASSPEVAGEYDTPKFGRYRTSAGGAVVFYPVLVAAMEEEMKEITAEEEVFVREMVAALSGDSVTGEGEVGGKDDDKGERVNGQIQFETHLPDGHFA